MAKSATGSAEGGRGFPWKPAVFGVLLGAAVLGIWLAARGWSEADLARLDGEWQGLIAEVAPIPRDVAGAAPELERLAVLAGELGVRQVSIDWVKDDEAGRSLESLDGELRDVLLEISAEIEAGRYRRGRPGGQAGYVPLLSALTILVSDRGLTPAAADSLARFARTIQTEGTSSSLNFGRVLLDILLERAIEEPEIQEVLQETDPPAPGELFAAAFREQIMLTNEFAEPGESTDWALSSADVGFEVRCCRAAILEQAAEARGLRDQPGQFESLPPPPLPGSVQMFLGGMLNVPSSQVEIARSLLDMPLGGPGKLWSEFVARWERVLAQEPLR